MRRLFTLGLLTSAVLLILNSTAFASFHVTQVQQVIGGVNGDTSAQAIQLRLRTSFQNQMQNARIFVHDASGANAIQVTPNMAAVSNFSTGSTVLIASPGFAFYTSPAVVPDFTMSNLIPADYLAAGSLTFEDMFGTVYWRLSWGGSGYTGATTGSFTNDGDGDFGVFPDPLPSSSQMALTFTGAASDPSTSNEHDYALSSDPAVFTKNSGATFTVTACQTITVTPASLPGGTVGTAYSQNLSASGSIPSYTFAVTAGSLPPSLALSPGGALTGTPNANGTFNFTVTATSSSGCTGDKPYSITVACPAISVTPTSLPLGTVNSPYSQTLGATGGSGSYTFAVTVGSLPANLTLTPAGVLSGIPAATGTTNFTVTATDSGGCTGSRPYALTITGSANGDINGDGVTNGRDIPHFVDCVTTGSTTGGTCAAGDFDGNGSVGMSDVGPFVGVLMAP